MLKVQEPSKRQILAHLLTWGKKKLSSLKTMIEGTKDHPRLRPLQCEQRTCPTLLGQLVQVTLQVTHAVACKVTVILENSDDFRGQAGGKQGLSSVQDLGHQGVKHCLEGEDTKQFI